jgi:hypothetical protein
MKILINTTFNQLRNTFEDFTLQKPYVGRCPLFEVYFIYTTFRELAVLPSLGD